MTNKANLWIIEAKKKLIKSFGSKCSYCGKTRETPENPFIFHHKHPELKDNSIYSKGRKERYYQILKGGKKEFSLMHAKCHLRKHKEMSKREEAIYYEPVPF